MIFWLRIGFKLHIVEYNKKIHSTRIYRRYYGFNYLNIYFDELNTCNNASVSVEAYSFTAVKFTYPKDIK